MRTSASGTGMGSSTSTAAAVISAQSTAVWPVCGWTIWRSSMWVVPAVERAVPCQLRNRSRSMSRTCPRRSSGIWTPTGKGWRKMSPIWTACGVSCTAASTPPSGAERSRKPRPTACGNCISFEAWTVPFTFSAPRQSWRGLFVAPPCLAPAASPAISIPRPHRSGIPPRHPKRSCRGSSSPPGRTGPAVPAAVPPGSPWPRPGHSSSCPSPPPA